MTAATETTFESKIEDAGPCRKRMTITASRELIDQKIRESFGTLATSATLPGFRKGRAPLSLIERRFGTHVRSETRNQIMAEAYSATLQEHDLKPIGDPEPADDTADLELKDGEAFTFSVEVEVIPEFDLPELEGIEVKKPTVDVDDDMVAAELKRQCAQVGEVVDVKDGIQEGDRLVGPGSVAKEGDDEPFFRHEAVDIIVPPTDDDGRGQVLGLPIVGLNAILVGKKAGDTLTIETVGPDAHELEHIRGKNLTVEVQVGTAQRIIPAEIAAVVEHYGLDSEDVLREQIIHALGERVKLEQTAAMREQIYRHFDETTSFDLPQKLTENQATRSLERQRLELMYRGGLSTDEIEQRLADAREEALEGSQRRLKLQFLMHRLAEHFEVGVSEQEINSRIASIAQQRGERPDALRTEFMKTGAINQIASQIRDHKACDRVIEKAKIIEVTAEEFAAEARERSGAGGPTKKKSSSKKKTTKKKTAKK